MSLPATYKYGDPFINLEILNDDNLLTDAEFNTLNSIKRKKYRFISCFTSIENHFNMIFILYIIIITLMSFVFFTLYVNYLYNEEYYVIFQLLLLFNNIFLYSKLFVNYIESYCILYAWDIVEYLNANDNRTITKNKIITFIKRKYIVLSSIDYYCFHIVLQVFISIIYGVYIYLYFKIEDFKQYNFMFLYEIFFLHSIIVYPATVLYVIFTSIRHFYYKYRINREDDYTIIQIDSLIEMNSYTDNDENIFITKDDNGNKVCSICLNEYNNDENKMIIIKCKHTICKSCIITQIKTKNTKCAICRSPFVINN